MEIYKPLPFRDGNKVLRKYERDFVDPVGNQAVITLVDFEDKKGVLHEEHTLYVRWKHQ